MTSEITFYGFPDNSPPGAGIEYPKIHSSAGGVGTYSDPITFATDPREYAPGTLLYIPYLQKYVLMEDSCAQCTTDWSAGKRHIDVWMNSDATHGAQLLSCQYADTRSGERIEENPPNGRPVLASPLFDTTSGVCLALP